MHVLIQMNIEKILYWTEISFGEKLNNKIVFHVKYFRLQDPRYINDFSKKSSRKFHYINNKNEKHP